MTEPLSSLFGVDTRHLFTGLVVLVALQRGGELLLSNRNLRRALARGGVEAGVGHYRWMVLLHAAFLVAAPLEVWLLGRPFLPLLAVVAGVLFVAAQALRLWVLASLGERWTTRVVVVPGDAPVEAGPYRFLRHPNYLAVIVEIAALPLIHTAWLTASLFSLANAWLLRRRIAAEEAALADATAWGERFRHRPRLVPGAGGGSGRTRRPAR